MKKILLLIKSDWHRYALETLVVIVGVLIAFSLSSWNETRKDRKTKDIYIQALIKDIQLDVDNLAEWNKGNEGAEEHGLYVLDYLENRLVEIDSQRLARAFVLCQYKPAVSLYSSTYNDLINSGNIRLIENLELKNLLDEYYAPSNWLLKLDDRITQTIWYEYRDEVTRYLDPTIFKMIYIGDSENNGPLSADFEKMDLLRFVIDWDGIRKSPKLIRELKNVLAFRVVIRRTYLGARNTKAEAVLAYLKENR